jgi:hypothetical protein
VCSKIVSWHIKVVDEALSMHTIQLLVCKARSVALPLTYFGNYMAILTMLKPPNATTYLHVHAQGSICFPNALIK